MTFRLNYICVCVEIFVHNIMVSIFICLSFLHNIIIFYTSSQEFCPIYLLYMGYSSTELLLHSHLY